MVSYADFEQAAEDSRKLLAKPSNDELLSLYALFKVAKGEDFDKATKPGMFDLKAKSKYNSWKKCVEEDQLTPEQAQEKYVLLVEELKVKYGYDANKVPEKTGSD
ncbi:Acyl-CoA-binding protein -like protein 1 [Escovopsis weberi]|uniref:Acyl-CoA-binding protein-like protein 1 n=1 Tax=Escovopsis weberi TaxID=150374 RepID=A0A0M8N1E7_ESCWE|nr:Acyl-CoA-binding protein -like protein 1 [Escovopsis weberi]